VIVPYPHHKDRQQQRNAEVLQQAGAAVVVPESELTSDRLKTEIEALLTTPGRLEAMAAAARGLRAVDPTATILDDMTAQGGLR
jgi:UDP-N-acetylglucosamine--N-acetylmuramyl-(pentapeptide) pyrophosphoryl-undecaprenol N-acetylglucosamine transferase